MSSWMDPNQLSDIASLVIDHLSASSWIDPNQLSHIGSLVIDHLSASSWMDPIISLKSTHLQRNQRILEVKFAFFPLKPGTEVSYDP
ncbi:hypothetical protein PoB_004738000 [Plakobranchus ocellatus]|uniref:Uncharacterized protein n=1 Tax=Plakobranchus ocellatus TaxID=259542 RepID=A0AAV4BK16_9GAST|nr:hypothetical protein PoB_004738000 [Plakobranchus ocellatus]